MTKIILTKPPPIPPPATNAELIQAINGYRTHLDEFIKRTESNLAWLTDRLQARLDAVSTERS
jgi:hypothetical protein